MLVYANIDLFSYRYVLLHFKVVIYNPYRASLVIQW